MGTVVEFNVPIEEKNISEIKKVCDVVESKIAELDNTLSVFDKRSLVAEINNNNKKEVINVSPELFKLMSKAKGYFMLTQGAFDITVGPLTEIWGFGSKKTEPPDNKTIEDALRYVGFDKIELDKNYRTLNFKDSRIGIDFGGLAKGYAVDEAIKLLKSHSVTKALINIGGDLYCMGTGYDDKNWSIGVKDPFERESILAILSIRNKAIATSGSYENFYIYNDKSYAHIIDPRSGYPVSNNLMSVTILADECAKADALATAVFVLGKDKGLGLIEKLPGIECFLVVNQGGKSKILMSKGMKKYIE
jgi:thiamine biosynthesis lipoprotein